MLRALFIAVTLALCVGPGGAPAALAQPTATATLSSQNAVLGEPISLTISVNSADNLPAPQVPSQDGLTISYAGSGSSFSSTIFNGRVQESRTVTHTYTVVPQRAGEFTIPSVEVALPGGAVSRTRPLTLSITSAPSTDEFLVRLTAGNASPYVGEPFTVRVTILFSRGFDRGDLATPWPTDAFDVFAAPPDPALTLGRGMTPIFGVSVPAAEGREEIRGRVYNTIVADAVMVPRSPGEFTIGPATATAALVIASGDFFRPSRTRWVSASSEPLSVRVRPLPAEGRPAEFSGLVGRYTVTASATPTDVAVGEPVTLKLTISGPPPLDRVPRPDLRRMPGFSDAFRVPEDAAPPKVEAGQVVFTQTIRPTAESVKAVPSVELALFDPAAGRYRVERSAPIPITVRPTRELTGADAVGAARPSGEPADLRAQRAGIPANRESPGALRDDSFDLISALRSPPSIALLAGPPMLYAVALASAAIRRRREADSPQRRRERALAASLSLLSSSAGPTEVSRALSTYFAAAFDRPIADGALTAAEADGLLRAAVPSAKTEILADELRALLRDCDAARFASSATGPELAPRARALLPRIDACLRSIPA
ncbi:MAG: BatD family protein [Phycisphaerales bacterium]|nr:BatD family protein [Phycisphaerales bacterium]